MSDEETRSFDVTETAVYPVLPLRDIVVFPHMIVPCSSGAKNPFARSKR